MAKIKKTYNGDQLLSQKEVIEDTPFGRHILNVLEKEGYLIAIIPGLKKKFYTKSMLKAAIREKTLDGMKKIHEINGRLPEEEDESKSI